MPHGWLFIWLNAMDLAFEFIFLTSSRFSLWKYGVSTAMFIWGETQAVCTNADSRINPCEVEMPKWTGGVAGIGMATWGNLIIRLRVKLE